MRFMEWKYIYSIKDNNELYPNYTQFGDRLKWIGKGGEKE